MRYQQKNGFTFVELLIAVLILAGAIGGVLLLYTTSLISSEQAWDVTVATTHAEHVLEDMRVRKSLPAIMAVDWDHWAQGQFLNLLPEETINVVYTNPGGDPLGIKVEVGWVRKSRANNVTLETKMTK